MLFHEEIENQGTQHAFKYLPREAQQSLIYYMGRDGDEWMGVTENNPLESDADWDKAINLACKQHGDKEFTLYNMPRDVFADLIMQMPSDFAGWHDTFKEYHEWYINGEDIPTHPETNRWPAIAGDDSEGLVDGWHRTHAYYKAGHATLPFIL